MPYRPDRRLISVEQAREILAAHGDPVSRTEHVPLDAAAGRVLAAAVVAELDVPPFARALMDGYAVRAGDTARASRDAPARLTMRDSIYTGHAATRPVEAGSCAAIATGAPLPPGADAVVMVEQSARTADQVEIFAAVQPHQNVGRAGGDLVAGGVALAAGTVMTPARVGVLAALGRTRVEVFARPRVAILSTGDEVVVPGTPLAAAQIYDSNTAALAAAVRAHGGEPVLAPHAKDDPVVLRSAFDACLGEDLVLFSGGTSVGERDYLLDVIAAAGTVHFEGLLLKPGRPTVFATVRERPVFGMPGNPVSCLTNMYLLVAPLLRRMAHLHPALERRVTATLASPVVSPPGRHQIYPVRLDGSRAVPAFKGSGEITSLAHADGYFEIAAAVTTVDEGAPVDVVLF